MILFELNTRLYKKSLDVLAEEHLPRLAALGFDWIWLMGIWRMGPAGVVLSRKYAPDFEGRRTPSPPTRSIRSSAERPRSAPSWPGPTPRGSR